MASDERTTIAELKSKVRKFREQRGWLEGWDARNFVISLVLEASELLEHFQWHTAREVFGNKKKSREAAYELSDVLYWVLAIADSAGIDLARTFEEKLSVHEKRYPAKHFSRSLSKNESLKRYYSLKKGK